jgi:hypothetical protein
MDYTSDHLVSYLARMVRNLSKLSRALESVDSLDRARPGAVCLAGSDDLTVPGLQPEPIAALPILEDLESRSHYASCANVLV